MTNAKKVTLAFDLYGTLLSTASIAHKLAEHFGSERGSALAATWRKYQLEYTWRLNSMGQYEPFSAVTQRSLQHTLAEAGLSLTAEGMKDLMQAYDALSAFPDVAPASTELAALPDVKLVVFSNGTQSMVENSVHKSPELSPYSKVFDDLIVVEEAHRFKPDPQVYHLLQRRMGISETDMSLLWLVSGNPFDVVGAKATGMRAVWVDRSGSGWVDTLIEGDQGRPTAIVKDLKGVLEIVKNHLESL